MRNPESTVQRYPRPGIGAALFTLPRHRQSDLLTACNSDAFAYVPVQHLSQVTRDLPFRTNRRDDSLKTLSELGLVDLQERGYTRGYLQSHMPFAVPRIARVPLKSLSVVVCSRNEFQPGEGLLLSLKRSLGDEVETIHVVDDDTRASNSTRTSRADQRIINEGHHGVSNSRRIGVEAASTDVVCFFDAHVRVPVTSLRFAVSTLLSLPGAGLVGLGIGSPKQRIPQKFGAVLDGPRLSYTRLPRATGYDAWEVPIVPGGAFVARKSDLIRIGAFDPAFKGWGYEDIDTSIRMTCAGLRNYVVRKSVEHFWSSRAPYQKCASEVLMNRLRTARYFPDILKADVHRLARRTAREHGIAFSSLLPIDQSPLKGMLEGPAE